MILLNETPFTLAPLAGQVRYPARSMTLIVKGTFDLRHGEAASIAAEQEYTSGDLFYDGDEEQTGPCRYESDFAYFKPRADLLLVGSCHPPAPRTRECKVGFRVGRTAATLRVIGDRFWEKGMLRTSVTDPLPFDRMELRAEHAFGGSDWQGNPLGKGIDVVEREGKKLQALPNLEDPRELVTHPKSRPEPACFAPHGRMWARRLELAGTYDQRWERKRWPWFPEDFDWGHFNAASPDLQVAGYLEGAEEIELRHLHPEHPVFESALPGVRIRAFAHRAVDSGEKRFDEIEMNLDTLWIDADNQRLILLWRGVQLIESEEMDDVLHVYVGSEELAADPLTAAGWRQRFDARLEAIAKPPEEAEVEAVAEAEAAPLGAGDENEEAESEEDRTLDATLGDIESRLAGLGVDPDKAIADMTAEGERQADDEPDEESGAEADEPWTRERVASAHAAGEDLTGADLSGLDLSSLDLSGADLSRAVLDQTILTGANLRQSMLEGASLNGAVMTGARLEESNLAEVKGEGVQLGEAALDEADLTGAVLMGVILSGASLKRTVFEGARLPAANLDRCEAGKADFSGADLAGASFREATLSAASLAGANVDDGQFQRASMEAAVLEGASAERADFSGADLYRLRASEGAKVSGATFTGARGQESIWTESVLADCRLAGVDFAGADFTAATLTDADLHAADLREARFLKADLRGADLAEVDLFRGSLERADLSEGDLRGSNLYEANLLGAVLDNARLEGANLGKTLLARGDS